VVGLDPHICLIYFGVRDVYSSGMYGNLTGFEKNDWFVAVRNLQISSYWADHGGGNKIQYLMKEMSIKVGDQFMLELCRDGVRVLPIITKRALFAEHLQYPCVYLWSVEIVRYTTKSKM